jgi:hypothetical protein
MAENLKRRGRGRWVHAHLPGWIPGDLWYAMFVFPGFRNGQALEDTAAGEERQPGRDSFLMSSGLIKPMFKE